MFVWLYRLLPFSGIKTDIIHFEWNFAAVEFFPLFDLFNCPAVVSCRGAHVQVAPFNPQRESYVSGMRRSFERASAVHCVSEMIQREAQEYGLDPEKAFVIRPAVDPSFFYPAPRGSVPQKYFHIVTTGSLIWRKGYEYALIAIRRLIDRGIKVRFDLIGDGPKSEMQRLLFAIDDLELQSAVFLMGALRPEEVRTRLQESHAFLLSSLSEGISNSVLEAMACGLPVVSTNCGGMAEAITDGVEGFLVPVRDPAAMADRLERLASDVGLQRRMGEAARARVIKEFSLTAQGERYVDIYRGLLAKARSAVERTVVEQRP
jgi:colanic acid/amylovoran biosynthesis glycosyltransferase